MKNSVKYYSRNNRIRWLYIVGIVFLGVSAVLGIILGSTSLSISEIAEAFQKGFNASAGTRIFAYSRLPRTLASLVCGAALAVSGAVIQGVLANNTDRCHSYLDRTTSVMTVHKYHIRGNFIPIDDIFLR